MELYGKLTLGHFSLIQCFSSLELFEILCAFCTFPRIAFQLNFLVAADDQRLGVLDSFTTTDVSMIPFLIFCLDLPQLSTLFSGDNY